MPSTSERWLTPTPATYGPSAKVRALTVGRMRCQDQRVSRGTEAGPEAWDFADAWVLTSIGVSHQPCELVDVIAAADGINHAVLMDTELETAISRLAGSDLVAIGAGPSFQLTERGADLLRRRDRKSTRLNSSHTIQSRMPSSA